MKNTYANWKFIKGTLLVALALFLVNTAFSQIIINKDPRIEAAVNEISTDNMRENVSGLLKFHTRHNLSSQNRVDFGIAAAATYIERKLKEYAKSDSRFTVERVNYKAGGAGTRLGREITLTNVVATIKGNQSDDRVIALLAHYDSRSEDNADSTTFAPGANDNLSGVSALLEIARIIAGKEIGATIKLMFLSGEEHGLLGAAHMAQIAQDEKWNLIAVLNNDMISNSHSSDTDIRNNSIVRVFSENIPFTENEAQARERVFNSAENDSPSRQLARYIKESGERYTENLTIKLIYRNDRYGRGGDHTPFNRKGFTAVRICEFYENYDRTHQKTEIRDGKQYGDVIEGVDFEYLRKNTSVNLSSLMNLAFAPYEPSNVSTNVSSLSNYTEISWKVPAKGAKPNGYYLLIRETDSPVWQRKIFVKGTEIKIPLSKDNYFFGVQSVSDNGNESLPVFSKGLR
jgi:hypothetical protein